MICEAAKADHLAGYATSRMATLTEVSTQSRGMFDIQSVQLNWSDRSEARLRIVRSASGLAQFQVEVVRSGAPDWADAFAGDCMLISRRQLRRHASGQWLDLRIESGGRSSSRPYNPPTPDITYPSSPRGPIVGHVDSGIDYRRLDFQAHFLADANGKWLARDAWDGDQQPFDLDVGRSPFFPREHGSRVLDVLLQETDYVSVIPLRYPRPQIEALGGHVRWLIDSGATLIMLPMGSFQARDWESLRSVIEAYPKIVFVISAGNNGVDLGAQPVYPAVFPLPNILTVTSVFSDGTIAEGANYGAAVDLGIPAENLTARGIEGVPATVSGSSFAVPIATAWLAKLQRCQPELFGEALINTLRDRLLPSPDAATQGWISHDVGQTIRCESEPAI